MAHKCRSLFATTILLLALLLHVPMQPVMAKAIYGVGMRIIGDELLVKDEWIAPPGPVGEGPSIQFNYEIPEPITYIEILSEENIMAEINISYLGMLVTGTVQATSVQAIPDTEDPPIIATTLSGDEEAEAGGSDQPNEVNDNDDDNDDDDDEDDGDDHDDNDGNGQDHDENVANATTLMDISEEHSTSKEPLHVVITIYGFKRPMMNVNPAYILNRDQHFKGALQPYAFLDVDIDADAVDDRTNEVTSTTSLNNTDDDSEDVYDEYEEEKTETQQAHSTVSWEDDIHNTDGLNDFEQTDKIIEVGARQTGDYLIYETHQISSSRTEEATNHSVTFYYVDSNVITYVKFIIYDHFAGKTESEYVPPNAEYMHFSPNTLKAVITDHETNSLFVQMSIYGYHPNDLPVIYTPFMRKLGQNGTGNKEASLPPLERLRIMLNAGRANKHRQPEEDEDTQVSPGTNSEANEELNNATGSVVNADSKGMVAKTSECTCTSAGTALSTFVAAPLNSVRVKTWWMVGLSLLRLFTAQPRGV